MAKASVLVVEDESIVAKDIKLSLEKMGYSVIGICATGKDAYQTAVKSKPNIILMDIMLKGEMDGIETAGLIKKELNLPVIYLTANADEKTLQKAKITEPYGYIIKPFKEIDLHTSIEMAIYKHGKAQDIQKERDLLYSIVEGQTSNDIIFVKANSRLVRLRVGDIYFIEALKDYVVINTMNTRYTIHSTMKDIEAKLPSSEFLRVHRSYIIQLDKIASIEQSNIVLEGDKKIIPIGGSYKDELGKRIKQV